MATTGWASLRVMLADDNAHMRGILMAMLKSIQVTDVFEAKDGGHAFDALKRWPADIAIVDFNMEPVNGVEFTRLVRTSPESPNPFLAVIMLTGHSEESRVGFARDVGVDEFLVKPVNATRLIARINAVVYKRRPFIRTATYFGPERRRQSAPFHTGPWRRETDAKPE